MPSPFPGMDPYLEDPALWPSFHERLVRTIHQAVMPGLVSRYEARVVDRCYETEPAQMANAAATEQREPFLEIRDQSEDRLVTLIEVVSPANKTTPAGRAAYLETRRSADSARANTVEIDLVLQGTPMLAYSLEGLPDWDHAVTVTRSTHPERYEIYTSTLHKRLPRFRVPLAASDRDTVLDLNTVFHRCYDDGEFAAQIDYQKEPVAELDEKARARIAVSLEARKSRVRGYGDQLSHDDVARLAYRLWQAEGCPLGRDQEHWYRAIEILRE